MAYTPEKILSIEEVSAYELCSCCLSDRGVKAIRAGYDGNAIIIKLCASCREELKKQL